jgi:phosphoribosylformylglycinamidine (FGAM) synthase PurS component
VKATIKIDLNTSSPEKAQQTLLDLCEKMKKEAFISDYRFEIETVGGPVTEKCVLAEE